MNRFIFLIVLLLTILLSCNKDSDVSNVNDVNYLSKSDQYKVCNKLLTTLYKPEKYEDLMKHDNCLKYIKDGLNTEKDISNITLNEYDFNKNRKPSESKLAYIYKLPLSKQLYDHWMTYFLLNTIMFSPSTQLFTVSQQDVDNVYNSIYLQIANDIPIEIVVYNYMVSQENWRRFRSPEDNTREMLEIFVGDFNDSDVPKAAQACKNWKLDKKKKVLIIGPNKNTIPVYIFGKRITTCEDFYNVLVNSKHFKRRVIEHIVNYMFNTYPDNLKNEIIDKILSQNPKTFRDIFNIILFSREYLYSNDSYKTYEQIILSYMYLLNYKPNKNFFIVLYNIGYKSKQAQFKYKLGRNPKPPTDSYSLTVINKFLRENIFQRPCWKSIDNCSGFEPTIFLNKYDSEKWLKNVFLSLINREPNTDEIDRLTDIFTKNNINCNKQYCNLRRTLIVLQYISDLTETYHFRGL